MLGQPVDDKKAPSPPKKYSINDLIQFESPETYSAFGKRITSNQATAPKYGFGTSDRAGQAKLFLSKELSATAHVGKTSPGPNYDVTDKFQYTLAPSYKIGTDESRAKVEGPQYDHYTRVDVDTDPVTADTFRKPKAPTIRMGLEPRFPNDPKRFRSTPGPQYNPPLRPEIPKLPTYSFGYRRDLPGSSPLAPTTSTPHIVGPGRYFQKNQIANTSIQANAPEVGFTKGPKFAGRTQSVDRNQTYDTRSAIGDQISSKKPTLPQVRFGKAHKDVKTGIFKDHMATQPTRIRIDHPKFQSMGSTGWLGSMNASYLDK